jgi:hypothetical protein
MMMENHYDNLKEAICLLKKKKKIEHDLLKEQFHDVQESLKPINLIKSLFHSFTEDAGAKKSLLDNLLGIATGFVSKKLLIGNSHNILKNIFGFLIQQVVQKVVVQNSDTIKNYSSAVFSLVNNFMSKKAKTEISH